MRLINAVVIMLCVMLIVMQRDTDQLLVNGWLGLAFAVIVLLGLAIANLVSGLTRP